MLNNIFCSLETHVILFILFYRATVVQDTKTFWVMVKSERLEPSEYMGPETTQAPTSVPSKTEGPKAKSTSEAKTGRLKKLY